MAQERKLEFNYSVVCLHGDGSHGCSLNSGAPTLAASIAKAFHDVSFYLREAKDYRDDGYPAVLLQMYETCGECHGNGYAIRTPRRSKKCPACKGVGVYGTLFESTIKRDASLAIVERAA